MNEKTTKLIKFISLRATSGVTTDTRLPKFQLTKCSGGTLLEEQLCYEKLAEAIIKKQFFETLFRRMKLRMTTLTKSKLCNCPENFPENNDPPQYCTKNEI